jgi:hypothetical protein
VEIINEVNTPNAALGLCGCQAMSGTKLDYTTKRLPRFGICLFLAVFFSIIKIGRH